MKRVFTGILAICLLFAFFSDASVIKGTVSDSISSVAIQNAVITLRGTSPQALARDTTDASGNYEITYSTAGTYVIRVALAGYTTKTDSVTIDGTDTQTVDISLAVPVVSSITGIVSDSSSGNPLDNITVSLRSGNQTISTDTTDATGAYTFANVANGSYTIRINATGYSAKNVPVTTAGAEPVSIDIALAAPVLSTISGTVIDSTSEESLSNVIVTLRSGNQTIGTDTTDANGTYAFANVANGNYTIRASLAGYSTKNVSVTSAGTPQTMNIALAAQVSSTISGTVTDSVSEAPVSGAVVSLGSGFQTIGTDTTDATGMYSFADITNGTYTLRASGTGFITKSVTVTTSGPDPQTANIQLAVAQISIITGSVSDSSSGNALSGVTVYLRSGMTNVDTVTTNTSGVYTFDNIVNGSYTITTFYTGYAAKSINVITNGTEPYTADIKLLQLQYSSITGVVTDSATGATISGVKVVLRLTGQNIDSAFTGTDGSYSFDSIATGTYSLNVSLTGYEIKRIRNVTVGTEPLTLNVLYTQTPVDVRFKVSQKVLQSFSISSNGYLYLRNFSQSGTVGLYNLNGKLLCKKAFKAQTSSFKFVNARIPNGNYIIHFTQGNSAFCRQVSIQ